MTRPALLCCRESRPVFPPRTSFGRARPAVRRRIAGHTEPGGNRKLKTIGRHLIAEFYGCGQEILDEVEQVRRRMRQAAELIGATIVGDTFHKFAPQGVSGSVVIAESHLSVHTWPENGYVAVDIYTCGGLDPRRGFRFLAEEFGATRCRLQEIVRGLPDHVDENSTLLPDDVQLITRTVEATEIASAS